MATVLIVEDDARYQRQLTVSLEHAGWQAHAAADWTEVCDICDQFPPNLAIIDWLLESDTDGLQIAKSLRKQRPTLPLILITGYLIVDERRSSLMRHFDGVLLKPFQTATLLDIIRTVCSLRQAPGSLK